MKRILLLASFLLPNLANAYYWAEAVPTKVALINGGLFINGQFDTSTSSCATGAGIFLENNDTDGKVFDRKLSMALMALASGKTLKVLINDPVNTNCKTVPAHGIVPVIYHNYWIVK